MADKKSISVGLKCDTSDYDKKLKQARESTRKFSKDGAKGAADMVDGFTKLVGAVAASKAAMKTFEAVIKSSQTIGDTYASTMHIMKSSVDQFVYAIANADFSRFNAGLSDIISKSRDAYAALDQLGNTQISYSYLTGKNKAAYREELLKVRDTSLPMADRQAALANAQQLLGTMQQQTDTYKAATEEYIKTALASVSGVMKESISMEDFVSALMVDIGADPAATRKLIQEQYNKYSAQAAKYGTQIQLGYGGKVTSITAPTDADREALARLRESNKSMLVAYELLFKYTDEELKQLTAYLTQTDNASYALGELKTQIREAEKSLNQPIKTGTVGAAIYPELTNGVRKALSSQTIASPTGSSASAMPNTLAAVEPVILYADAYKTLAETSVSAAEGLGAISSAMGSISGVMDEGSAAWMNYASGIISAVSSALPALQSLATAQAAAAATGAALNPWTAIAGVAAVASIGAALANLPKFAQGGVVGGNSYFGDKMLIRVNSGERVLTREQNAAYERGTALNGKVEFVIRDSVLYGILNRGNAYNSRSYHGS